MKSIAILGGGASGLTLANALGDHANVVVFEREREVGGKSHTVHIDGRAHDLGATMGVPIDYKHVVECSRDANIATEPFPLEEHWSLSRGRVALNRWHEMPRVLAETAKYVALHSKWRIADGLHHATDLHAPWREVVARHDLHVASKRTLCYRTGYGYGFDDEVPAVMHANVLRPQTLLGLAMGSPFMWTGGTQPIWKSLARRVNAEVRTGTAITRITRDGQGAVVHSRGRAERFDRVVITCDPGQLLSVLDASSHERDWFSQIRTYPYATFACEVEGLTDGRTSVGYIDENMCRDRIGHPMAWVKRYADQDIYVFHLFAPDDIDPTPRIAADVARLGGRFVGVRAAKRWRFFPHFTSAFMQRGGLAAIDQWQGQHATFLVGEALSFSTLARVTEHALAMAPRILRERPMARSQAYAGVA